MRFWNILRSELIMAHKLKIVNKRAEPYAKEALVLTQQPKN